MSERSWSKKLSAYLDGELSLAEKLAVERALAKDTQLAKHLAELKTLTSLLQSLPRVSAPAATIRKLLKRIVRSDRSLVDAYFDQELSGREKQIVERYLLPRPKAKEALKETERTSGALDALPRMRAPEDSQARLLASLANDEILADLPSGDAIPANTAKPPGKRRPYHELLSAYLDNELPASLRPTIEKKLRESANARRVLGELEALRAMLQSLPHQPAPPQATGRLLRKLRSETASRAIPETAAASLDLGWSAAESGSARRHVLGRSKVQRIVGVCVSTAVALGFLFMLPGIWHGTSPVPLADSTEILAPPAAPAEAIYVKDSGPRTEPSEVRALPEPGLAIEPQWADLSENQDLPIEGLAGLSLVELAKLDGGNIRLWSGNTATALDRLWIVLHDNEASIRTDESSSEVNPPREQTTIVASISPLQLAEILRDLIYAEKNRQLFARVDVEDDLPAEETEGSEKPTHQLVARIETANPVAMPLPSGSKVLEPNESGPLFPPMVPSNKPPKPSAKAKERPASEDPLPRRITVSFVLETE